MIRRVVIGCALVAIAGTLTAAGCAFGPLPPVADDSLLQGDERMTQAGFQVMADAANPSQPAAVVRYGVGSDMGCVL